MIFGENFVLKILGQKGPEIGPKWSFLSFTESQGTFMIFYLKFR